MLDTKICSLEGTLQFVIKRNTHMRLEAYMQAVITHYYAYHVAIGPLGDFITAPEISQLFGEMVGIWCAQAWEKLGCPTQFHLIEYGPGKGTLMHDIMRATRHIPDFHKACHIKLIETSGLLRDQQHSLLGPFFECEWVDTIEDIAEDFPIIVVANEFFDALPITQYVKTHQEWVERVVIFDENEQFGWGIVASGVDNILDDYRPKAKIGEVIEISHASQVILKTIAKKIKRHKGAGLIIDYGYTKPPLISTLQALSHHQFCSVFHRPGEVDVTSHVDFAALTDVIEKEGCIAEKVITQREFLKNMGISERAKLLARSASSLQKASLKRQIARLTSKNQMGDLFKVLCFQYN